MSEHKILTEVNKLLRNSVNGVIKTISPNRTPARSRANSIGGSQEDESAPPTEERIQQARLFLTEELIATGFMSDSVSKPPPPKITSVIPT
jgi:hypothetical protein